MELKITHVDAFTKKPFAGNPAAVCILSAPVDERWMQNIAREMNLSETAFLYPQDDGFNLRWFTPAGVEVDLCGHATLASAHVLWEEKHLPRHETARFHTRSGLLTAQYKDEWIELDFPSAPVESATAPTGLQEALGITPKYIGTSKLYYLAEVESESVVRALDPNFDALRKLPARGIVVTSLSSSRDYDFVSRFFAPKLGVNEDPVTGSAHCCLGPYWKNRLHKDEFLAYQASPRGGVVRVQVKEPRVLLGGQAITVLRAGLAAPTSLQAVQ